MRTNAAPASASDDRAALAMIFDRIARFAPPGYGSWASIANDGATAARVGDLSVARKACSACHSQFRARYKAEMRAAPLR
jgi:hypothetical protein